MNIKIPKNIVTLLLVCFALLIWGHNGYKFFKGVKNADELDGPQHPLAAKIAANKNFEIKKDDWVYESKFRDPFKNWLVVKTAPNKTPPRKRKQAQKLKSREKKVQAPVLRLTGLIKDTTGFLAIIENLNQDVFFAKTGDTVAGVKIVSVDSNRIACEFKNQKFTLNLK